MARLFNGSTDGILATLTPGAINFSTVYTISFWVYANSWTNAYTGLVNTKTNPLAGIIRFYVKSTGVPALYVSLTSLGDTSSDPWPSATALGTGSPQHILLTFDASGSHKLYYNGVQNGNNLTPGSTSISTTFLQVSMGYDDSTASRVLDGRMADIAHWTAVLSATEITALAQGTRPWRIRRGSLVNWWPLDGLASPEPDLAGPALNGVLTGTTKAFGPPFTMFTPRWPQFSEPPSAAAVNTAVGQTIFRLRRPGWQW